MTTPYSTTPYSAPPSEPAGPSSPSITPPAPRKRWVVVLVGVMVLIALILVAGTALFATRTWPPLKATYRFTQRIEDGDISAAYSQVCNDLRSSAGRGAFEDFAHGLNKNTSNLSVNILSVNRNDDTATVDFTAERNGARNTKVRLKLVYEGGEWRPCGARTSTVSSN